MDYATALRDQNGLLVDALLDVDLSLPVPTCPGWTLLQLLRHVGRGDRWAAQIITDRADATLDPRQVRGGKPPEDRAGALRWLRDSPGTVIAAVNEIGPATEVATFLGARPASWWLRRRLHEATVHRADVAISLGAPYRLSPELAADGMSEWLDRLADQPPEDPLPLADGVVLALSATDEELSDSHDWLIRGTPSGPRWSAERGPAAVSVRGRASDLFLAIVRRRTVDETPVEMAGDRAVWEDWLARTPF
jgi:uncharacterized protein (TIGR03083 family)